MCVCMRTSAHLCTRVCMCVCLCLCVCVSLSVSVCMFASCMYMYNAVAPKPCNWMLKNISYKVWKLQQ